MKESKIRDNLLRIFFDVCDDLQIASNALREYCEKNRLPYVDAIHGSLKTDNDVALRKHLNRFFMANGEVDGIKRVLNVFYTDREIDMLQDGCLKKLRDTVGHDFFYDELSLEEVESDDDAD